MQSRGPTGDRIESIHNKQNERKNMVNCTVHINDRNWTRVNREIWDRVYGKRQAEISRLPKPWEIYLVSA